MFKRHSKSTASGRLFSILIAAALGVAAQASGEAQEKQMAQHPYVGLWVTDDGRVRHELLANGRYDEARGSRQSAYRGRYEVTLHRRRRLRRHQHPSSRWHDPASPVTQ
jgi:hypothetical protein